MKIDIYVEPLTKEMIALSKSFHSGNPFLDNFIKSADAFNFGLGKTFVWINDKRTEIIGYYNIGVGYIDMYDGNEKLKIGGSVHLNFFALDKNYRGKGVNKKPDGTMLKFSDVLLNDFILRVRRLREEQIGFSFITLAATKEGYSLYKRNGFDDLDADLHFSFKDDEKGCIPMYFALDI